MKLLTKILLLLTFFFITKNHTLAQKRFWDHPLIKRFTSSTKDSTRSPNLLFFPVLAYSQETGLEFGATGIYNFYTDKTDSAIYTSSINTVTTFTTEKQLNLKIESDIWTKNNDLHYIAALRYKKYPFNYYGLGGQTLEANKTMLTQNYIQLNFEVEKKIVKHYYIGINSVFENFTFKEQPNKEESTDNAFDLNSIYGGFGGKYIAIGVSQLYDNRNSNTETTKGFYGRMKYAYAPNIWGAENYSGGIFSLDIRAFFPLLNKLTLGAQGIFQTLHSNKIPFYLTPQLGNDEMMRGYYQGRYRDKNYLAGQSEIRYRIHPRIGMAAFLGAATVYNSAINLSNLKFSGGGGLRYFFDLEHNSSLRLDYAIGEKNPGEKRQGGFYLALGQAF